MADKGTDSRLKLTITEVKERQSVGDRGAVKLGFYATEGESDKALSYFTFSTRLFETIEKKGEIDCDVNISQRTYDRDGDIQTFTDRKVFQIYVDGQPIGGKRGGWQDSPEKIASEERRSRMHAIKDLWIAGMFDEKTPEVKKMRQWMMEGDIPIKVTEPKTAKKKPEDVPFVETEPEDSSFPGEEQGQETPPTDDLKALPMANLGNLFASCLKYFKMNQTDVLKELGGITKESISDPQEAWSQIVESKEGSS